MNWKELITNRRTELIITVLFLAVILFIFPNFLAFVEERQGVILADPILELFNPIDLTWLTFALIYISLIVAIFIFAAKPEILLLALQSYSLLVIFRMMVMYSAPLDAPEKLILLNDPFVQFFGSGEVLTKDLFFSGHTATLFLLFLLSDKKQLKIIFLISTVLVGIAVLLQHVHYTIDVLAAPFFAYASYRIAKIINGQITFNKYVSAKN
ncbi:MAG: phosphatase PAP2-related protein [Ignavibacteriaceae bacterium]|jgi:membrane-associated phospholipid phosphatase